MNLLKLDLARFRSYDKADFSFEPGAVHILQGANAQGKTNVIEAICYLSNLRSFRTSQPASLVKYGETGFALDAKVETGHRKEMLRIYMDQGKKHLFHNGNPVGTFSAFVGILNAVLFCPDDLTLFTDSPSVRRKFVDTELVKLSRNYTSMLSGYQKLLKSRNNLLKNGSPDPHLLAALTEQMTDAQLVIMEQRARFIHELMEKAGKLYPFFSRGEETLTAVYKTAVDLEGDARTQLQEAYARSLQRDLLYRTTSVGVHKDDVLFYLNGHLLAQSASQGQKRSALLALKLALCEMIKEKSGEYPVFLLDDVFSELDSSRQQKLIDLLMKDMQIFITTASPIQADWNGRPVYIHEIQKKEKEQTQ